jgi:hypothetical protein
MDSMPRDCEAKSRRFACFCVRRFNTELTEDQIAVEMRTTTWWSNRGDAEPRDYYLRAEEHPDSLPLIPAADRSAGEIGCLQETGRHQTVAAVDELYESLLPTRYRPSKL